MLVHVLPVLHSCRLGHLVIPARPLGHLLWEGGVRVRAREKVGASYGNDKAQDLLFLIQKQTPREARTRQRMETMMERVALGVEVR